MAVLTPPASFQGSATEVSSPPEEKLHDEIPSNESEWVV